MLRQASVPLPLAGFGLELLEAHAERAGVSMQDFMVDAAKRYLAERDPERPSSRVPRFLSESGPRVGERTVEVELSPELWCALEKDAASQGVPLELLVSHAAVWHAARLDSQPAARSSERRRPRRAPP